MMFPPPGVWLVFAREPTLAWALSLKSSFTFSIRTWPPPGGTDTRERERRVRQAIVRLRANAQGKGTPWSHKARQYSELSF